MATLQKLVPQVSKKLEKEISVGANECRLARQGERLVARGVLADVVVTIQVCEANFAAMLRFSVPEEPAIPRARLEELWNFADQAIEVSLQSIRSMNIPAEAIKVSVIGGADRPAVTFGRGKQLALAVQRSFWRLGVVLNGDDLGGTYGRLVWLESSSGRLIVRTKSSELSASANMVAQQAKAS